jgi:type VI protein secretion system component Hcp
MDNADVFLLLLRPTRVPVVGQALSQGFQGQVQLQGWTWSFHNDEEKKRADSRDERYNKTRQLVEGRGSAGYRKSSAGKDYNKKVEQANKDFAAAMSKDDFESKVDREKFIGEHYKELADLNKEFNNEIDDIDGKERAKTGDEMESEERSRIIAELDRNENFEFSFSKRVDIATTQLLNSMKAGDVFPSGVLTIHQRSPNQGMTLVINVQRVRLLDYSLKVEVSETMTDMREEWTAEFGALAYVYKNRGMVYDSKSASQEAPRLITQGTVRAEFRRGNARISAFLCVLCASAVKAVAVKAVVDEHEELP